jgi:ribonucleotide reductase beta subunit family protein with ferritin-like domain
MFFGKPLGVQRYDNFKYPQFENLTKQQLGYFWRPEEVSLQKDRGDYQTLRPEQKHVYTSNLKYQIMLDSVQGRAPGMAFLPYCSLPELEACMEVWSFMEMIHSRSYTYVIKNVYADRSLIARDENQHLAITQNILNNWKKGDDKEMVEIVKEEEEWTYQMFDKCVNEEKKWAEYLFKDGSMIGLNDKLLHQYVEFIANKRLRGIGLKPKYDIPAKNNPLPWTEHWISSKGLQVAPQETEVESYMVGGIKQDVKKDTFSGFKL